MMTATKTWHCDHCGEAINPGDKFEIRDGEFFKEGHAKKQKPLERPKKHI